MTISISTRCPFDDSRTCLRQNCRACDIRLETLMHIRDELREINLVDWGALESSADMRDE